MKIGYQGEIGSNAESATLKFIKEQGINENEVEIIPLTTSKNVVSYLKRGIIDYGVMAFKNKIAGTVKETYEATKDEYLEFVGTIILPIEHCIFKKKCAEKKEIKKIASHIQALKQTEKWRKEHFPNSEELVVEDTALAARLLHDNIYSDDTAVICRKNAGLMYDLDLIYENIYDEIGNATEFRVLKCPSIDYDNTTKPKLLTNLKYH